MSGMQSALPPNCTRHAQRRNRTEETKVEISPIHDTLLETLAQKESLYAAFLRVKAKPGIDGQTIQDISVYYPKPYSTIPREETNTPDADNSTQGV